MSQRQQKKLENDCNSKTLPSAVGGVCGAVWIGGEEEGRNGGDEEGWGDGEIWSRDNEDDGRIGK